MSLLEIFVYKNTPGKNIPENLPCICKVPQKKRISEKILAESAPKKLSPVISAYINSRPFPFHQYFV